MCCERLPLRRPLRRSTGACPSTGARARTILAELHDDGAPRRTRSGRPASARARCTAATTSTTTSSTRRSACSRTSTSLQRDMCPSATRFEGEIIAMALDLMHADAVRRRQPVGLVTSGGTGSILHAMLAYREHARRAGIDAQPNIVKPETAHPAFDKACHLFGVELRTAPHRPRDDAVVDDPAAVAEHIDDQTIAIVGSACNYGYGTIDPIEELGDAGARARRRPARRRLPRRLHPPVRPGARLRRSRSSTSASPGSRASRPTPTSTATRSRAPRRCCSATRRCATRSTSSSPTGAAASTSRRAWTGSRSGGLLAATWASMVQLGREGYLRYAQADLRDLGPRCRRPCARTRSCGSWAGRRSSSASPPTSSTSTTSTTSCAAGLAVQRPAVSERHPHGRHPAADAAGSGRGVRSRPRRRRRLRRRKARVGRAPSSGAIYGGVAGGSPRRPTSSSGR